MKVRLIKVPVGEDPQGTIFPMIPNPEQLGMSDLGVCSWELERGMTEVAVIVSTNDEFAVWFNDKEITIEEAVGRGFEVRFKSGLQEAVKEAIAKGEIKIGKRTKKVEDVLLRIG